MNLSRLETTSGTAIETQTKGHPKTTATTRRDSQNPRPHTTAEASAAGRTDYPTQLAFMAVVRTCHVCGSEKVVGNSTQHRDDRYVCRKHNLEEWAAALSRNKDPYYRELGRRLQGDASRA